MRLMNRGVARLAAATALVATLGVTTSSALAVPTAQITRLGAAPSAGMLSLVLPLRTDKAGLARLATAVSTPGSPDYGQFESIPALVQRFGAPAGERLKVLTYLRRTGATSVKIDGSGLFADATMSVGLAQKLFGGDLAAYRTGAPAASATRFVSPTVSVHVPAGLAGAVTGVVGLDTRPLGGEQPLTPASAPSRPDVLGPGSGSAARSGTGEGCPAALAQPGFTPNQYLTAYGYGPLFAGGIRGAGERVALIEIDGYRPSDVQTFDSCFNVPFPKIRNYGVSGIHKLLPAGGESTLDLELLSTAAPDLSGIDVYQTEPRATNALRALTVPLLNRGRKPDVISASLGNCEASARSAIGARALSTAEASLELAAASGISVLASSGDDGSSSCFDLQGLPTFEKSVNFPGSSPWVTGVGGTNITLAADNSLAAQTVWNDAIGAGGGGYSTLFARPSWQTGFTTARHRVVPDVAMLADPAPGYEIYCSAKNCHKPGQPSWVQYGGTSAGTPLLAGGLALIDESLRTNGRQNLGLVNPLLYKVARLPISTSVIKDVTDGSNDFFAYLSAGRRPLGCCTAVAGFDPASGLGGVDVSGLNLAANAIVSRLVSVGLGLPAQRHPVRAKHLLARVSCTARCMIGVYAKIRVGRSRTAVTQYSQLYRLKRAGAKLIRVPLSRSTLRRLSSALRHHQAITATLYGAVVDPVGNIERHTAGLALRVTG